MEFEQLHIERNTVSLRERVADVLRAAIVDGRFEPGTRLIERELCSLTGVSRTSIREALRRLEAEGLVKTEFNRGPIVTDLGVEDAQQIYDIREALEPLAVRLFTERADDKQIARLKTLKKNLRKANGDLKAIAEDTREIYNIILDGCGNAIVGDVIRGLQARVGFLRVKSMSHPGRTPTSIGEMEKIIDAIDARDTRAATAAATDHVRNACQAALTVLRGGRDQAASEPPRKRTTKAKAS